MPTRKENKRKMIYFSPEEWDIVCKKAAAMNMRTGTYIRRIAVKGRIKKVDLKQLNHLQLAFDRIGVEVNQIARVANNTQSVYRKDIEDIQEKFIYLRDVLTNYLHPIIFEDIPWEE